MDGMLKSVGGAWSSLTTRFPQLSELEERLGALLPAQAPTLIVLGDNKFKVLSTLGEGGYSTAYLVQEVAEAASESSSTASFSSPAEYALKQIFLAGPEEESRARSEIKVLQSLNHTNIIHLVASSITTTATPTGARRTALLLFPAYKSGSAWDAVQRAAAIGRALPLRVAMSIFIQLCAALEVMHAAGLAHRDVKPQNLLLDPRTAHAVRAVLMDLGSAGPARVTVTGRAHALALQEEAEAHCTAPYRAPELWEVEADAELDEKVDVWAAGCVLYCLAYRESPFERATAATGGSLKLAVLNGGYTFPEEPQQFAILQPLIRACLQQESGKRPSAAEAKLQAQTLMEQAGEASLDPGRGFAHLTAQASV